MGTVIVESVFAWPGVGLLAYQAVVQRDFPMMQGIILVFVCVFVIANLITDVVYCYLDPRVRYVNE
jgi:peptide/nickel transport system permease protein